jgi:putative ABC transport system substrate-binding protein
MKRREFITLIGGAVAWPLAARAQQGERVRRIGVLMNLAADDPESLARIGAFLQGLQELGWTDGRNVRLDYRWGVGDPGRYRSYATELAAAAPDLILGGGAAVVALQQATRTVPIVFVGISDPVGVGVVASLARPGGNITGFAFSEYGTSAKSLELLKQIAPAVTRAAVLRDPSLATGIGQLAAIQAVAPSLGVAFVRGTNDGLIVTPGAGVAARRELIVALAARHRLPAVYPFRYFVTAGGLISYGSDPVDPYRRAAGYVDRILKGEKPADLPVQAPTKYELVINLKTAKALGLEVPPSLLARADEVIE